MNYLTVSEVSKAFEVSTRMLRYYESAGLLSSLRRDGYSYRIYDEDAVKRLQLILVMRKLRVPLKHIAVILDDKGQEQSLSILRENIAEIDTQITALDTIRGVLGVLVSRLDESVQRRVHLDLLDDRELISLAGTLAPPKQNLKEDITMDELNKAGCALKKLTDKDVRIIHIAPATVAAAHFIGDEPEDKVGEMIADFTRKNKLWKKFPGLRLYGFNHPCPVDETNYHGYEMWVTIPDDMEVPKPLMKKRFSGGTYAAHTIAMGDFHEWAWLDQWVRESSENGEYAYCGSGSPEDMFGSLEEHLNYHDHIIETPNGEPKTTQLDLLIPIRKK